MKVEYLSPGELYPYPQNAKIHTPDQVKRIAASIKAFGFQQPIVVDKDNVVIIGHGRLFAAQELMLDQVPVVRADDLTEDQVKALRLADNKLNESPYDFSKLEAELAELDIAGFDMEQFGFSDIGGGEPEPAVNTESSFHYQEQYAVTVLVKDEAEQQEVYERLTGEGYECKVVCV